jgi:hypothetical protein
VKQKICCIFGVSPPNMKIMQYSDHIYIEPFESTTMEYSQKNDDEVELEQYQSFTVEDKSKIKSYLNQETNNEKETKVNLKVVSPEKEPVVIIKPIEEVKSKEEEVLKPNEEVKPKEEEVLKPNEEVEVKPKEKEPREPDLYEEKSKFENNLSMDAKEEPRNEKPKEEKLESKVESSPMTPIPELDFKKNHTGMGILEMDYFSPKKKKNEILSENLNEVVPHKSSKLSILMEENQQLKQEIEKYKKEKVKFENQTTPSPSNEVKNEEEKYSLLTLVMVAILFFFVGKLL